MKKHRCLFHYNPQTCKDNNINVVVLHPPKNIQQTRDILQQLCQEDLVKLCILQNWCIPGIYPFCFPHRIRSSNFGSVPLLETTASKSSTNLLNKMLLVDTEIELPKHIVIQDDDAGALAYLSVNVLTPTPGLFVVRETLDNFIVSKASKPENESKDNEVNPNDTLEGSSSDECDNFDNDADSESDLDDVVYACQGPQPPCHSGDTHEQLDVENRNDSNHYSTLDRDIGSRDDHGMDESGDQMSYNAGGGDGDGGGDDSDGGGDDSVRGGNDSD